MSYIDKDRLSSWQAYSDDSKAIPEVDMDLVYDMKRERDFERSCSSFKHCFCFGFCLWFLSAGKRFITKLLKKGR